MLLDYNSNWPIILIDQSHEVHVPHIVVLSCVTSRVVCAVNLNHARKNCEALNYRNINVKRILSRAQLLPKNVAVLPTHWLQMYLVPFQQI